MDAELAVTEAYPYDWNKQRHGMSLDELIHKYRPSMVENDGTKPWLWVRRESYDPKVSSPSSETLERAETCLQEVTKRVQEIMDDASIPVRSNKKTGTRSKKELREEVQNKARDQLRAIATGDGGEKCGKWLLYAGPENVDVLWKGIATSLIDGLLSQTPAFTAKVSTSALDPSGSREHVICIYLPNIFDKDSATSVLKILIEEHGVQRVSAKPDLYTHIGLDSKHASGMRSTIWQVQELLSSDEVAEIRSAFKQKVASANAGKSAAVGSKTKARRKGTSDEDERENPFESSDDGVAPPPKRKSVKAVGEKSTASTARPFKKRRAVSPPNDQND